MKDFSLLVWLTQLGFSVAFPMAGFICLAVWLRERFGLGSWVLWLGIVLGFCTAFDGLRYCLRAMLLQSRDKKKPAEDTLSFNEHH